MYDGFILEIDGNRKYFDWKNLINPTWVPQIFFNDLNQDGEKELIVILTMAAGTGVHQEQIHMINPHNLAKIEVENPFDIIKQRVKTSITKDGKNVTIQIAAEDKITNININKEMGFDTEWLKNVYFGNINRYQVINRENSRGFTLTRANAKKAPNKNWASQIRFKKTDR